jgi:predicted aspartyl protease
MPGTVDATGLGNVIRGESMRFPYTLSIARSIDSGNEIVVLRPEIPVRVHGPAGTADMLALVDTGADSSILPLSVAHELGIETTPGKGPGAMAFGGERIALSFAEVVLEVSQHETAIRWPARLYFADFPDDTEKAVILGHEGFLDYFTATFDGEECVVTLEPNGGIPISNCGRV